MDSYQLDQLRNLTKKVSGLDRKIDFIVKHLNLQNVDPPLSLTPSGAATV